MQKKKYITAFNIFLNLKIVHVPEIERMSRVYNLFSFYVSNIKKLVGDLHVLLLLPHLILLETLYCIWHKHFNSILTL